MKEALLLTCEHATNHVPKAYRALFAGKENVLETHRGLDIGALALARDMAHATRAPLLTAKVSRLLVELNRSRGKKVFSEFATPLTDPERRALLETYYDPHRQSVTTVITNNTDNNLLTIHIGVHSFTPVLRGETRKADIALLFDPQRPHERRFCHAWQAALRKALPGKVVRRNYPYLGRSDGLTTSLRRQFAERRYVGIELEVNQKLTHSAGAWATLRALLCETLVQTLSGWR